MQRIDKTTKILLGMIVLLLAAIAFKPYVDGGVRPAQAQTAASGVPTSFRAELVNRIVFRDPIQGMEVIDSNHVFLVRTSNSVEVYRVDDLPLQ